MWNKLLERSFDKWSATYDADISKSFSRRGITYGKIWNAISNALAVLSGVHLLEIGIGTRSFGPHVHSHTLIGLDISKAMLTEARKTQSYTELIHSPANHLPLLDETFDGIFSAFMLHSERGTGHLLRECRKVLKTGGQFVVVDLFPRDLKNRLIRRIWSNIHSFRHEQLAPSNYTPITVQASRFELIFGRVRYAYIDADDDVHRKSPGHMSHGISAGERL